MGSRISPNLANLYMEHFEQISLTMASTSADIWYQ